MSSIGRAIFQLGFEISPIVLTNGIAQNMPGGAIPIVALLQPFSFLGGLLGGQTDNVSLDDFFARFRVVPGGTLKENQVSTFPFANQAIAANAIIVCPKRISLLMTCPATPASGGFITKLATISQLVATLEKHDSLGGTYTVATPSLFYQNCLLLRLVDASTGESKQAQVQFQWDFFQPLLTLNQAARVQSSLTKRLSSGSVVTPNANGEITPSGAGSSLGDPSSIAAPSVVPSSQGLPAASIGASTPLGQALSNNLGSTVVDSATGTTFGPAFIR